MASTENLHECTREVSFESGVAFWRKNIQISAVLNLSELVTAIELQVVDTGLVEVLLAWPLKSFSPSLVAKPVTNEVSITSVD